MSFNSPEARELEKLLYAELVKLGKLDFVDLLRLIETDMVYGLRKVSSGAIMQLRERWDVNQCKDEKGNMCFEFKKEMCTECGELKPYRELVYGQEPVCRDCNKR